MQADDTARQKPSLSAAFNAVAQQAVADFPTLANRFVLVDIEEGQIHGLAHPALTNFSSIEALEQYLSEAATAASDNNTSTSRYDGTHNGLTAIFYNSLAQQEQVFGSDDVENALGVVHHELGHILVPGGMDDSTPDAAIKSENIADLFSALRKARRDGDDDPAGVRLLAFTRARKLILDGGADAQEHFTTFSLLELADMMQTTSMGNMPPQMAVGMAEMLGGQYAPSAARVRDMAEAFAECRGSTDVAATARKIAAITTSPAASDDVFKLGSFVMSYYLKGLLRVNNQPLKLEGAYWDDIREKIAAREAKPAKPQGLLIIGAAAPAP
jgi:hypothetical protein